MSYRKKLVFLLSLISALALVYALSLVFDPERTGTRSAAYTWLDPKLAGGIIRIRISESGDTRELVKKNSQWFILHNGRDYPARALRVEDFIGILTKRAAYPLRSSSPSSHQRLGLTEDTAAAITVYGTNTPARGQAELPLLDLLAGYEDNTGREIYLRRRGQNEVRSGDSSIISYIAGSHNFWYNLRLIPESENGGLDADDVQRLTVYGSEDTQPQVFSRWNREWSLSGLTIANPDIIKIDAYVRSILNTEGDDFDDSIDSEDSLFNYSRIVLELGDGSVRTIRLSQPDETGRCFAAVDGCEYVYSLSGWAAQRLFKTAADFEKQ